MYRLGLDFQQAAGGVKHDVDNVERACWQWALHRSDHKRHNIGETMKHWRMMKMRMKICWRSKNSIRGLFWCRWRTTRQADEAIQTVDAPSEKREREDASYDSLRWRTNARAHIKTQNSHRQSLAGECFDAPRQRHLDWAIHFVRWCVRIWRCLFIPSSQSGRFGNLFSPFFLSTQKKLSQCSKNVWMCNNVLNMLDCALCLLQW